MQQCLAILLFHECIELSEMYEEAERAATQALWSIYTEKRREMYEHAERCREMVEEGWLIQAEGYAPSLGEQRWAFLRKMRAFRVVSRSQAHPSSMLRSCLALVSCSCLNPAAPSVSHSE